MEMAEALITNEALQKWMERIGVKLRVRNIHNRYATPDSIRKFALCIGDPNPLWIDEEYAKNTAYGRQVAPPSWLYSVFPTWVSEGLPGVHGFHSGNNWRFYKPVFSGDIITPECINTGFSVKKSEFAGKTVIRFQRARYYNQRNELVAEADSWAVRAERRAARERGKYSEERGYKLPIRWTAEEVNRIVEEALSEEIRGSNPRYWEDVNVGDTMKLTKGPLSLNDMIAFTVGADPVGVKAFRCVFEEWRKHPAWYYWDPEAGGIMPIYAVHFTKYAANRAGLPYPYDVGVQRNCFAIQLLTNWMGDDGWIKTCYLEYRRFFYITEVLWYIGKVVRKFISDDGEYCVDMEIHAVNQRREDTARGYATVALPSRSLQKDDWPIPRRIRKPNNTDRC
jgi:acyl dehydratase